MNQSPFRNIHNSDSLRIDFIPGERSGPKAAVTFTWSGNRRLDGPGYAGNLLSSRGFDVVAFKSSEDRWFQDVPGQALDDVAFLLDSGGYERRVGYGDSMGGTAAIQFSKKLKFDTVLAYSPQYRIDMDYDGRFSPYAQGLEWRYAIDSGSVSQNCLFVIVFDPYDADLRHVEMIGAFVLAPNLRTVRLPFAGHNVAHFLKETKLFKGLAISVLEDGMIPPVPFRQLRGGSKTYLMSMSRRALAKGRKRLSLSLISRAAALAPDDATVLWMKSQAHFDLGQAQAAMRDLKRAAENAQDDAPLLATLSNMFSTHGDFQLALATIDQAIALDASVSAFQSHREAVLLRLGHAPAAGAMVLSQA